MNSKIQDTQVTHPSTALTFNTTLTADSIECCPVRLDFFMQLARRYNCFRWVETVDAHSGYHFPWSPFSYFSIFGGAKAHDIHHSRVFVNYGASIVWDKLLGTGV